MKIYTAYITVIGFGDKGKLLAGTSEDRMIDEVKKYMLDILENKIAVVKYLHPQHPSIDFLIKMVNSITTRYDIDKLSGVIKLFEVTYDEAELT